MERQHGSRDIVNDTNDIYFAILNNLLLIIWNKHLLKQCETLIRRPFNM